MTLSGISTQGHKTYQQWIKSYEIFYSVDGLIFENYRDFGLKKVSK